MPLYIRDDQVKELAVRAAKARPVSLTEAVREAPERLVADIERERAARDRAIDACLARLDALARHDRTEEDMYDEDGIPR